MAELTPELDAYVRDLVAVLFVAGDAADRHAVQRALGVTPALLAGWLFIFLMSARVLALAILLAGPRSQTMAVALFDLWGNGQGTELAALGLIWSMLMAMIAAAFYALARRSAAGVLARA